MLNQYTFPFLCAPATPLLLPSICARTCGNPVDKIHKPFEALALVPDQLTEM